MEAEENNDSKKSESRGLNLDTTGEYLSFDGSPHHTPQSIIERGMDDYYSRIFIENAWFIHENDSDVIADGRIFLAPAHIKNHLAYTGTSGLENPTFGVYAMWWANYPDYAIDKAGNLVWYIAGSPLTGSNACLSVTPQGESVKMEDGTPFMKVWRSFMEINEFYADSKKKDGIYTFEEALIKLHGDEYSVYLDAVRREMIDLAVLYDRNSHLHETDEKQYKLIKCARREQLQLKWREILDFYGVFLAKESEMKTTKEKGDANKYRHLLHELAGLAIDFINTTFGRNANHICPNDIIEFARQRKFGMTAD